MEVLDCVLTLKTCATELEIHTVTLCDVLLFSRDITLTGQ